MKNSILYFETCPCKYIKTFLSVKEGENTFRRFSCFDVSPFSTHEGLWSYFLDPCGARKFCCRLSIDDLADKLFEILMKIIALNRPWFMNNSEGASFIFHIFAKLQLLLTDRQTFAISCWSWNSYLDSHGLSRIIFYHL